MLGSFFTPFSKILIQKNFSLTIRFKPVENQKKVINALIKTLSFRQFCYSFFRRLRRNIKTLISIYIVKLIKYKINKI